MSDFALTTTARTLLGGVSGVDGQGQLNVVSFLNGWAAGDTYSIILTDARSARQTIIGAGNTTGVEPVFAFVHDDKVYVIAGASVYFSALSEPTKWNDLNGIGNGFVTLSNKLSNPEDLKAMTIYQGKAVFLSRNTTLIYRIDADPANWSISQTLSNIGTVAGKSVQSLGELEVLMLADAGIRSLRTRETSLNAFVVDIGSPIDSLVSTLLGTLTDTEKEAACSIVEPSSNRYWCFVPGHSGAQGTIYVLSYFPTSEIIAWSTYEPTYEVETDLDVLNAGTFDDDGDILTITGLTIGATYRFVKGLATSISSTGSDVTETVTANGDFVARATTAQIALDQGVQEISGTALYSKTQTAFTPQTFVTYNGQVYCRDANALYVYGGSDNATYDAAVCEAEPPWLNAKSPTTAKQINGLDAAMEGRWDVSIGTNPDDETSLKLAYTNSKSSLDLGKITVSRISNYYKVNMKSRGSAAARFCSVLASFEGGAAK